jgi:hypothetical protein
MLEIVDAGTALHETGVVHQFLMQRDVGLDALDAHLRQGNAHPANRLIAAVAIGDHLGDHRVVMRRNGITLIDVRVDANPGPARGMIETDLARRRNEGEGIFGVDPAFDGMAAESQVALPEAQLLTGSNADLLGNEIDAGDQFGDRMLDLDAGVHLDEVELVVLVEEFERCPHHGN